eukprot:3803941-Amphidinium_carterae.1
MKQQAHPSRVQRPLMRPGLSGLPGGLPNRKTSSVGGKYCDPQRHSPIKIRTSQRKKSKMKTSKYGYANAASNGKLCSSHLLNSFVPV